MKRRPICLFLAGALLLGLTACGTAPAETPTPSPDRLADASAAPTPDLTPESPTPTPTPEPFAVQEADVPPGEYEPWQEAYADFMRELRQKEGTLRNWVDSTSIEERSKDMDRQIAYNDSSEEYSIYDVDKDGVPELFIKYGNCEADYFTICYTFRDGQVTEIGLLYSGHSSFFTWPDENGIVLDIAHQGLARMEKYSVVDGQLVSQGIFFEEEIWGTDKDYTAVQELVPGSEDIPSYYCPTHWRPGDSPAPILQIYNYGSSALQGFVPMDETDVRAAIEKVLWEQEPFFGVSGDGFNGDTGWTTLEEYFQPGMASPYSNEPLIPEAQTWADVNGDGQLDCVLSFGYWKYTVLSVWEDTVYGYFFHLYRDTMGISPDGQVYLYSDSRYWWRMNFYRNQCYTWLVPALPPVDDLAWEEFPAQRPDPDFFLPEGEYSAWQLAYMDYLTGLCEDEAPLYYWLRDTSPEEREADPEKAEAARSISQHYWLYDVDKDNVPELFIEYGDYYYAPWIECYTYRKGKVTQIGKIHDVKGANLFTWPGKNALLNYWAWKGAFILWEYSIVNGELVCVDEDGIASQFGGPGEPNPRDYVPGTVYLEDCKIRTPLSEDEPLLLPICNYGGRTAAPAAEEERAAAREAIEGALYRQEPFYGQSGDNYYTGATGWVTMEQYCKAGGADHDALTPVELVWLDLNGDGAEECVVRFQNKYKPRRMAVFHFQDGVVYAYYLAFGSDGLTADGVFYEEESIFIFEKICGRVLRFHQNQCYWECIPYPETLVPAVWEPFPGSELPTP